MKDILDYIESEFKRKLSDGSHSIKMLNFDKEFEEIKFTYKIGKKKRKEFGTFKYTIYQ